MKIFFVTLLKCFAFEQFDKRLGFGGFGCTKERSCPETLVNIFGTMKFFDNHGIKFENKIF